MYKDYRYINAGENEFYRWGNKAISKVESFLTPNSNGYYSIPVDGGKYWSFGTNEGKFGEFAKFENVCFSVNKGGYLYAKADSEKGVAFVKMLQTMIEAMKANHKHSTVVEEDEDDE